MQKTARRVARKRNSRRDSEEEERRRRRAYSCTYAVLNCTCMTEVCVCKLLRYARVNFPQVFLLREHDRCDSFPFPILILSTLFCLLLSLSDWFEMSESGEAAGTLRLMWGELLDGWVKTDKETEKLAELSSVNSVCILISFRLPFATSYSLPIPCPL